MSEQQHDHTGTVCPFCGINGLCAHPVKEPPIPPWQPNIWFKNN
jgi:hypothetical protein